MIERFLCVERVYPRMFKRQRENLDFWIENYRKIECALIGVGGIRLNLLFVELLKDFKAKNLLLNR